MTFALFLLAGFLAAVPVFGILLLWRRRPQRRRTTALLQLLGAIALSVVVLLVVGAFIEASTASTATLALLSPTIIGSAAVAMVLNRMANQQEGAGR
ncbi:hypothetical protein SAMN04487905_12319 [Actinopolyspora xinjiangensis]|uniref:Uncharacterized protein n=1 Tax=Actinopolyspora xinjiangensis TaxID=405564 RepID=A0A1H0X288_9ACTN|nr:hypothetical protein SAMN04487905_12319 [Actinopolyspora xinjiangensis]